jgi:hypothetical protein
MIVFWPRSVSLSYLLHLLFVSAVYLQPGVTLEVKSPEKDASFELFTAKFRG